MLNKIVTDNNLDVQLLINLQSPRTFDETLLWDNTIYVEIDADDTATQSLEVDGGTYGSTSYPITPGQVNTIEIEDIYWNYDGTTTVTLVKGGSNISTFDIIFPEAVDSLGMLNQDESLFTQFTMSGSKSDPSDMAKEISDISHEVEQISQDLSGKQNYIDKDILVPTGSGQEGDLCWYDVPGLNCKALYRYENEEWVRVRIIGTGQNAPSGGENGDVYLQHNGAQIIGIYEKVNNVWIQYITPYGHLVDYSTTEQDTEVKYLDGSDIFEKTYFFTTAISLLSDTWTSAVQSNLIGQIIDAEGWNENGDMIPLAGRMNSGYVQVVNLLNATQNLKTLALKYIKAAGTYDFNANYQSGQTYTFLPTIDSEEFLIWLVKHFIDVCKTKSSFNSNPTFAYILSNLSTIVARFMQYKGNNNGIGVSVGFNRDANSSQSVFFIYVAFANGNKTARVAESYTEHGDASKYLWGNESQSSLWATNGEYCYRAYVNKTTGDVREEWDTPQWAYTMYIRYLGVNYSSESDSYLSTEDISNYGIHLT